MYSISFFKISFLRPLVLKEAYTKLYHEEKKFAGYIAQIWKMQNNIWLSVMNQLASVIKNLLSTTLEQHD